MCWLCILIPILVGLLCALLGYLLGRQLSKKSEELAKLSLELEACRNEKERLLKLSSTFSGELERLNNNFSLLKAEFENFILQLSPVLPASVPFDAELAASVFGKKIMQDDLKIVEGIGPKIEELFQSAGITTWKALAETPVDRCRKILADAGEHFVIHDPKTWPKQSELAYLGKWNHLKEWQERMLGGKE
jgi:hypothetical protein